VSDDAIAVEELSESMQRFALSVEHCTDVSSALEQLKRSKFEAVIVVFRLGTLAQSCKKHANPLQMNTSYYLPSATIRPKPLMHLRLVQLSCYGDLSPPRRST